MEQATIEFDKDPQLAELQVSYKSQRKTKDRLKVTGPDDLADYFRSIWDEDTIDLLESVYLVCLNGAHHAIGWIKLSTGGLNSATVDPRIVFGIALKCGARSIILAHNHPGGGIDPSPEDYAISKKVKEVGDLLGIKLLDHFIVTSDSHCSMSETAQWRFI